MLSLIPPEVSYTLTYRPPTGYRLRASFGVPSASQHGTLVVNGTDLDDVVLELLGTPTCESCNAPLHINWRFLEDGCTLCELCNAVTHAEDVTWPRLEKIRPGNENAAISDKTNLVEKLARADVGG